MMQTKTLITLTALIATVFYLLNMGTGLAATQIDRQLLDAASQDLAMVQELTGQGANVNTQDPYIGNTPLIAAAASGRTDIAKFLLDNGADVNGKNSLNETALMVAAQQGNTELVNILIQYGADQTALDSNGLRAAHTGQDQIAQLLQTDHSSGTVAAPPDLSQFGLPSGFGKVVKEPWFPPTIDEIPLLSGMSRDVAEEQLVASKFAADETLLHRKVQTVKVYTVAKPIEELAEYYLPIFNIPPNCLKGEFTGWYKFDENGKRDFSLEGSYILILPSSIYYQDRADITRLQTIRQPLILLNGEKSWLNRIDIVCLTKLKDTPGTEDEVGFILTDLSLAKSSPYPLTRVELYHAIRN